MASRIQRGINRALQHIDQLAEGQKIGVKHAPHRQNHNQRRQGTGPIGAERAAQGQAFHLGKGGVIWRIAHLGGLHIITLRAKLWRRKLVTWSIA
jgi:hypothetical protein